MKRAIRFTATIAMVSGCASSTSSTNTTANTTTTSSGQTVSGASVTSAPEAGVVATRVCPTQQPNNGDVCNEPLAVGERPCNFPVNSGEFTYIECQCLPSGTARAWNCRGVAIFAGPLAPPELPV